MKQDTKANTRLLVDIVQAHVAAVLSDIYKIKKYEVYKNPVKKWVIDVECEHSEREGIMVMFSFTMTNAEAGSIIDRKSTTHLFRTGRYEIDKSS